MPWKEFLKPNQTKVKIFLSIVGLFIFNFILIKITSPCFGCGPSPVWDFLRKKVMAVFSPMHLYYGIHVSDNFQTLFITYIIALVYWIILTYLIYAIIQKLKKNR